MLRRILCSTVCVAGLAGTLLLLPGCGNSGVDKSGPAVPPSEMPADKQKQYQEFMKSRGQGGGGAAPGAKPPAPGGAPGGAPGSAPAGGNIPMPPHG